MSTPTDNVSTTPLSPIVIRLGALGDMINVSALLQFLHGRYGRPCVVIGVGPWSEPVFRGNPDVAGVWALDRHWPFLLDATGWRVMSALRGSAPAPIYICDTDRHLRRVRRLLALSGVDQRRCLYLADQGTSPDEHYLDSLLRFGSQTPAALRAGNYPPPPATEARVRLPRDLDAERGAIRAWLGQQGWSGRPLVLIQPGNRRTMSTRRERHSRFDRDDKSWPAERWIELLRRIHTRLPQARLLLCGAREEGPWLGELRAAARLDAELQVATLPLRPLFALCEMAHSMVSIDTGPAHAAAALGLPLVVMFGAQRQSRWLPRSAGGAPVIGLGGPPLCAHVRQIPVDAVFEAWCSLLGGRGATCPRTDSDPIAAGVLECNHEHIS